METDSDSSDSRTYAARWPRKRRRAAKSPLRQCVRSLAAFMFGLFLASVYGCITFFLQHYGFWFCLGSTVTIAALCAFGMGLSIRVRAVVWLVLPTLCCCECPATDESLRKTLKVRVGNFDLEWRFSIRDRTNLHANKVLLLVNTL